MLLQGEALGEKEKLKWGQGKTSGKRDLSAAAAEWSGRKGWGVWGTQLGRSSFLWAQLPFSALVGHPLAPAPPGKPGSKAKAALLPPPSGCFSYVPRAGCHGSCALCNTGIKKEKCNPQKCLHTNSYTEEFVSNGLQGKSAGQVMNILKCWWPWLCNWLLLPKGNAFRISVVSVFLIFALPNSKQVWEKRIVRGFPLETKISLVPST